MCAAVASAKNTSGAIFPPGSVGSLLLGCVLACLVVACDASKPSAGESAQCTDEASLSLYQRRIQPVLTDDHPKSCNQCHLAGIDLSLFVRATPCQTMACLVQQNLVDFAAPERSKVLGWIGRAQPDSQLITPQVIAQEHDGVLEWIRYSARCGQQVCPTFADPCNASQADAGDAGLGCAAVEPDASTFHDPGDCSERTLEQLFSAQMYAARDRCFPCHFVTDQRVPSAPKWIWTSATVQVAAQATACAAGSLETMRTVLERGYVDLDDPAQSLLLRKPLVLAAGGLPHGGGEKFGGTEDATYQDFLTWIDRYAACAREDPALQQAGAPPSGGVAAPDAGASDNILGYCNCVLVNCHEQAHTRWGVSDDELLAGCRAEAVSLPKFGAPTMSGNFLECRASFCEQFALYPADACSAALGGGACQ